LKKLVDTILSKVSGRVLVSVLAPCAVLLVAAVSLKIYLVSAYPESVLKGYVTAFIKDNFNKAVTFDDAYVSVTGNIVVSNLNVSISSDFNDNISLVKCRSVEIRLAFFSIFSGRPVIRGISFEDPDITLYKKYGKGYLETFNEIFRLTRPVSEISQIDRERFYIEIDNSRLLYREVFRDDTLQLRMERVGALLTLRGDVLEYDVAGRVLPLQDGGPGRGRLRFRGKVKIGGGNRFVSSVNSLDLGNFDISYLNSYLRENVRDTLFTGGGLDASLEMNTIDNHASVGGRLEITNLQALEVKDNERVNYVSNENLNLDFLFDAANGFGRMTVRRLNIYDDNFRLALRGVYNRNALEEYFDVSFETGAIDLARMSENITPVRGALFRGRLKMNGRVRYDLFSKNSMGTRLSLDLEDFAVKLVEKKGTREAVKRMKLKLALRDDELKAELSAGLETSQFDIAWESYIKKWSPLSTESFITLKSPVMAGGDLLGPVRALVEYFYQGAYDDKKIGYEQIMFRTEPLGEFLNSNNVKARLDVKKVVLGQRASLAGVSFDAGLAEGRLFLENFTAAGYNGEYAFKVEGMFNLWQPLISVEAGIKNFDLKSFCADAGVKGEISGSLNVGLSFQVGAFRLAQVLENAIMDVTVDMGGGTLKNTPVQDRFAEFLKKQGFKDPDVGELAVTTASLAFSQRADNFQVTRLALLADKMRFYARGRYQYDEGLNVPVEVTVSQAGTPGGTLTASLELKGPLAMPRLFKAKGRNDKNDSPAEPLTLFNVN
jgi:hypothetical protein